MSQGDSEGEWAEVPNNPGPEDLGYQTMELRVTEATVNDHYVFLPDDEELLREEAFVVADEKGVVDPAERL